MVFHTKSKILILILIFLNTSLLLAVALLNFDYKYYYTWTTENVATMSEIRIVPVEKYSLIATVLVNIFAFTVLFFQKTDKLISDSKN